MAAVAWAVPSLMGPLAQKQVVERSWVAERGSKEEKERSHKEREEEMQHKVAEQLEQAVQRKWEWWEYRR